MFLRAVPYAVMWLSMVLLFVDLSPTRAALAALGVAAGFALRVALPRPLAAGMVAVVSIVVLAALVVTASSLDGLVRSVVGGICGIFGVYCLVQALRG